MTVEVVALDQNLSFAAALIAKKVHGPFTGSALFLLDS